jgi:hypothetical protein
MQGNTKILLLNTPSFTDTEMSESEIIPQISTVLGGMRESGRRIMGIIYFYRIGDVGMEGSPLRNLQIFQEFCEDESLKNVVLATGWDEISGRVDSAMEAELQVMLNKGAKLSRFDGSTQSAVAIVDLFLGKGTQQGGELKIRGNELGVRGSELTMMEGMKIRRRPVKLGIGDGNSVLLN